VISSSDVAVGQDVSQWLRFDALLEQVHVNSLENSYIKQMVM
jgi:hypothetical protein